jgi:hypothetical protein
MPDLMAAFAMQLATRAPVLLAYMVGLILACSYWKRYPRPCLLVALAMCVALLVNIVSACLVVYLPRARLEFNWDAAELSLIFSVVGVTANLLLALAVGMMLAAVFAGRRSVPPRWVPEDEDRPMRAGGDTDTRIQG